MVQAEDILLTTKDNPFNPFTEYDNWRSFDTDYGYNTEAYWSRLLGYDTSLSANQLAMRLMVIFEETININNELGYDVYVLITRDGQKLEHVPDSLLMSNGPPAKS